MKKKPRTEIIVGMSEWLSPEEHEKLYCDLLKVKNVKYLRADKPKRK